MFVVQALFGPPGSGVEWLRLMIEQMTGLHTGSVNYGKHEVFEGEGKFKDVSNQYKSFVQ